MVDHNMKITLKSSFSCLMLNCDSTEIYCAHEKMTCGTKTT